MKSSNKENFYKASLVVIIFSLGLILGLLSYYTYDNTNLDEATKKQYMELEQSVKNYQNAIEGSFTDAEAKFKNMVELSQEERQEFVDNTKQAADSVEDAYSE